ncbi:MAG: PEP-CTERM sorting domain-containing protein [Pirellulales bacterium]|nr:PEP-CTERM sorting domain-containing protein [Pirellulales bacterium]
MFAGGVDDVGVTDAVTIHNPFTDSWSADTLSVGRRYLGATSLGNAAFFAGGEVAFARSDVVDVYSVPEPSTLVLLGMGAGNLLGCAWRRRRSPRPLVLR